jgi:hypothetical protein
VLCMSYRWEWWCKNCSVPLSFLERSRLCWLTMNVSGLLAAYNVF